MVVNWIETSREVFAVIRARHPEMKPFASFTDPGEFPGDRSDIRTEYGFPGADESLLRAESEWICGDPAYVRLDESHRFWIAAVSEDKE